MDQTNDQSPDEDIIEKTLPRKSEEQPKEKDE